MFELQLPTLMLVQNAQPLPPVPGEGPAVPATGTTGAPGTPGSGTGPVPGSGATGSGSGPFGGQFFFIMLLVLGGMIVFSIMGQKRDRKKREALISAIKKHDRVQTIGGVVGSVVDVKPDYVVLKVDESSNTRITFTRAAIQQVLTSSPDTGAAKVEEAK